MKTALTRAVLVSMLAVGVSSCGQDGRNTTGSLTTTSVAPEVPADFTFEIFPADSPGLEHDGFFSPIQRVGEVDAERLLLTIGPADITEWTTRVTRSGSTHILGLTPESMNAIRSLEPQGDSIDVARGGPVFRLIIGPEENWGWVNFLPGTAFARQAMVLDIGTDRITLDSHVVRISGWDVGVVAYLAWDRFREGLCATPEGWSGGWEC